MQEDSSEKTTSVCNLDEIDFVDSGRIYKCLIFLFRNTYQIQKLATEFGIQSELLREISVNAAIAAGHAGNQVKVFTEIANQIGLISNALEEGIQRIQERTIFMSNRMLGCLRKSAIQQKILQGLDLSMDESKNHARLFDVKEQLNREVFMILDEIHSSVTYLYPEKGRFRQLVNRVWSIVISLRVSASFSHSSEQEFYLSIADALSQMVGDTEQLIQTLTGVIDLLNDRLESRYGQKELGGRNAL